MNNFQQSTSRRALSLLPVVAAFFAVLACSSHRSLAQNIPATPYSQGGTPYPQYSQGATSYSQGGGTYLEGETTSSETGVPYSETRWLPWRSHGNDRLAVSRYRSALTHGTRRHHKGLQVSPPLYPPDFGYHLPFWRQISIDSSCASVNSFPAQEQTGDFLGHNPTKLLPVVPAPGAVRATQPGYSEYLHGTVP